MDKDGGALLVVAPGQRFGEVINRQWIIGVALWTQCKGFAEETNYSVDVSKIVLNVGFDAGPCEVSESRCLVRMADWTLVQDQLKMLHSVVQVID